MLVQLRRVEAADYKQVREQPAHENHRHKAAMAQSQSTEARYPTSIVVPHTDRRQRPTDPIRLRSGCSRLGGSVCKRHMTATRGHDRIMHALQSASYRELNAALGAYSALTVSEAWELTFEPADPGPVIVAVHSESEHDVDRAASILSHHRALRISKF